MITVPGFSIGGTIPTNGAGMDTVDQLLNAAAHKVAYIFPAPKAGVLNKFEFRFGAITAAPTSIRASFQGVDATGMPDGVVGQFRTVSSGIVANTWCAPGLLTSDGTDTGTKRTVALREMLACVIDMPAFSAGNSFNVNALDAASSFFQAPDSRNCYISKFTTVWAKQGADWPLMALQYSDGSYACVSPIVLPMATAIDIGFTVPVEHALRMKLGVKTQLGGVTIAVGAAGLSSTWDIVVYDETNAVMETVSSNGNLVGATTAYGAFYQLSSLVLDANKVYRIALKPTSGSINLPGYTVPANAYLAPLPGGIEFYSSNRSGGGAWTDTTNQRFFIIPYITGVDAGSSGGGGSRVAYVG